MTIVAFASGDPESLRTWSNVPALAIKALRDMGNTVYSVNLEPSSTLARTLLRIQNKLFRLIFGKSTMILVQHFPFWKLYTDKKVKQAVRAHKDADVLLFFSYSATGSKGCNIPSVLFCDFTIEYALKTISKRTPNLIEQKLIEHQNKILESSDAVISLFPQAAKFYSERYINKNIFSMKGHVINSTLSPEDENTSIKNKKNSHEILFIGRKSYKNGAIALINAVKQYNMKSKDKVDLTIIGMTEVDLMINLPIHIKCIGYLDKSDATQSKCYYDHIKKAVAIINPTKNWGGISSIVEAMWFYTPVITSAYPEFVEIFGSDIRFGKYIEPENVTDIVEKITYLMNIRQDEAYTDLCKCSHNTVKDYTWDAFAGQIDNIVNKIIHTKQNK